MYSFLTGYHYNPALDNVDETTVVLSGASLRASFAASDCDDEKDGDDDAAAVLVEPVVGGSPPDLLSQVRMDSKTESIIFSVEGVGAHDFVFPPQALPPQKLDLILLI